MIFSAVTGAGIGSRKLNVQGLARDLFRHLGERQTVEHPTVPVATDGVHPDHSLDPSGDDRHFLSGRLGAPHDLAGRFADERRLVEHAFPSDHEVRFGQRGIATSANATTRAAMPQPDPNDASSVNAPPPSGSGSPRAFSNVQPKPRAAPVPPSTVAVPPRPTTIVLAPRSAAVQINSPTPRVVVRIGSRSSGSTSARPQAVALSRMAVSPSIQPSSAGTDSPIGPVTASRSRDAPAGRTTSSKPLPPSATGHSSTVAPGTARRTPVANASATCRGPSVPLKAAGATRTTSAMMVPR